MTLDGITTLLLMLLHPRNAKCSTVVKAALVDSVSEVAPVQFMNAARPTEAIVEPKLIAFNSLQFANAPALTFTDELPLENVSVSIALHSANALVPMVSISLDKTKSPINFTLAMPT